MLGKDELLEAARKGIEEYVDEYNRENESQVDVIVDLVAMSVDIDGGNVHGAYTLKLEDL
jgi:hypothetical protein